MKNKSLIISIVNQQCPGCRSEKMFIGPAYSKKFNKMHKKCPRCSQTLEPEPGFYTGAMYISYALQVAIIVAVVVATKVLRVEGTVGWYLGWIAGINLLFFPLSYRISRSIWAHLFIPLKDGIQVKAKES
ncbi:MAG: DUF983 domain-containing protein [Bacteroidota bacterium]